MKRWLRILTALGGLLAVLGLALVLWLGWTTAGARWVLELAADRLPGTLRVGSLEGRLADRIRLAEVTWQGPGLDIDAEHLVLAWQPAALLRGEVRLDRLAVAGLELIAKSREKEEVPAAVTAWPAWPRASGWPLALRARIARLELAGARYQPADGEPLEVGRVAGDLVWRGGRLTWRELELEAAPGRVTGRVSVGFAPRRARADLEIRPREPGRAAGLEVLAVDAELAPGKEDTLLAGRVGLRAKRSGDRVVTLESELALDSRGLRLDPLQLERPDRSGTVQGELAVAWQAGVPPVALRLHLEDLDLRDELAYPGRVSGTVAGTLGAEGYQGRFDLASAGAGWAEIALAGTVAGDWKGLRLDELDGGWLGGSVSGQVGIFWAETTRLEGELSGRGLDPGRLAAGWEAALDLDVAGELRFPRGTTMQASWTARLLPSRFQGRPVQGALDAAWREGDLVVDRLLLGGPAWSLAGGGSLSSGLEVEAEVGDLGEWLAAAEGSGRARGTIRWSSAAGWDGQARVTGTDLAWRDWHANQLQARGRWPAPVEGPLLEAEFRGLARGAWGIDALDVRAAGTPKEHHVEILGRWAGGDIAAAITGGWQPPRWQGRLESLVAEHEGTGRWTLQEPVTVLAGAGEVRWERLELLGAGPERLAASGELALSPLAGTVRAAWQDFDLGWVGAQLPGSELEGESSGQLALEWVAGRLETLEASLEGEGSWRRDGLALSVSGATLDARWGDDGLQGQWRLEIADQGRFEGELRSRQPPRLALPERGRATARWREFELALLNPWLGPTSLTGTSSGDGRLQWDENGQLSMELDVRAAPTIGHGDRLLALEEVSLGMHWDESGLSGELLASIAHPAGRLKAEFSSAEAARLSWPDRGRLEVAAEGVDLGLFKGWLPPELGLEGHLSGTARGRWLEQTRLDLEGRVQLEEGRFAWRSGERQVVGLVRTAALNWSWNKSRLAGELDVELAERGSLQGRLTLPVTATLPPRILETGAVDGHLRGRFREDGLLGNFLPGLVQDSRGTLALDVEFGGSWRRPLFDGTANLADAGGYLPAAGIHLREVAIRTRFRAGRVVVEGFQARSGTGQIRGKGEIELAGLAPRQTRLVLEGEDFRAVDLPELQVSVSPDLTVEGQGSEWLVRGDLLVPEAMIRGPQGRAPVRSSPDLVIVDAPAADAAEADFILAANVRVELGDHVLVKAQGVDARLEGSVQVTGESLRELTGQGRIEVAQGHYSAFGVRLEITRGALIFSGVPIDRPTLDILALRTIDEIEAGVRVTGTPRQPVVKLYSEPAMPDTDVLAYIVLGHPLGGDSGQSSLLMSAAATLLSQGESAVLQDRLKRQLGIDVIDVQTGEGDMTESVVTIGKYLSPELYISFGQSLFSNTSQVGLRYDLGRHWQVESSMGVESGVDLFYRITFD